MKMQTISIVNEDSTSFKEWDNGENLIAVTVIGDEYSHGVRVWLDFNDEVRLVTKTGYANFTSPKKAIALYRENVA